MGTYTARERARLYDEEFSLLVDMDTDWLIKLQGLIPVFAKILID
jgi:hypothetical protein